MIAGRGGMAAVMLRRLASGDPAVVHLVGVGEAIGGVATPWPKASTAGGATKHSAAKAASVIANLKRKPVVSAVSMSLWSDPPKQKPKAVRGARQASLPRL